MRDRKEWRERMRRGAVYEDRHGKWVKIELTQDKEAMIDADDLERVLEFGLWCAALDDRGRYYSVTAHKEPSGKWKQYKLHRFILDCWGSMPVDHRDGNGLNCRKHNLRICTTGQNARNRRKGTTLRTSSHYVGVSFERRRNWWIARIQTKGETTYLGHYSTQEEAAIAYDKKALELHKEFAVTNFEWQKTEQDGFVLVG